MLRGLTVGWVSLALTSMALAGETVPRFTKKPAAVKEGDAVRIEFAIDRETDVTVAVLNAKGMVVRHLAAGMLGKNAPAPLAKDCLKQDLLWDGTDDLGKPATGGPFRVNVALGMKPALGRVIGQNPAFMDCVRALTVGPEGQVYVFHIFGAVHGGGEESCACVVFDRDGRYVRTVLPYPGNLPEERLRGIKRIKTVDGRRIPFLYQGESCSLIPGAGPLPAERPIVTSQGRLAFVGLMEAGTYSRTLKGRNAQLVVLNIDGSPAEGGMLRAVLAEASRCGANLALSPDEKTIYVSGVRTGSIARPTGCIYTLEWDAKTPRVLVSGLTDPRGIDVDGEGRLYVADRGGNAIRIFKPDGSAVRSIPVGSPEWVEVHRRTGDVYVVHGTRWETVTKFAAKEGYAAAAALAADFGFPGPRKPPLSAGRVMALDDSAERPTLWIGSGLMGSGGQMRWDAQAPYRRWTLLRVEDLGHAFGQPAEIMSLADNARPAVGSVMAMDFDRHGNRLVVNGEVWDPATGRFSPGLSANTGRYHGIGRFGLDGNFYLKAWPFYVYRMTPDFTYLPFPEGVSGQRKQYSDGALKNPLHNGDELRTRGATADAQGNVYALWNWSYGVVRENCTQLFKYDRDGRLIKEYLIDCEIRDLSSVRVDYQGNIYVSSAVRPGADVIPASLKGCVPDTCRDPDAVLGYNYYAGLYGSVLKFGPEGGKILPEIQRCDPVKAAKGKFGKCPRHWQQNRTLARDESLACNYADGQEIRVKGAQWIFPGASPQVSWYKSYFRQLPPACGCSSSQIDVDGYGRVFFPDACQFRVGVLDTNGNLITWVGAYGNQDSAGPGSRAPSPEIAFQWPWMVCVSDQAMYVGDRLNRRVVEVRLRHAVDETVAVP